MNWGEIALFVAAFYSVFYLWLFPALILKGFGVWHEVKEWPGSMLLKLPAFTVMTALVGFLVALSEFDDFRRLGEFRTEFERWLGRKKRWVEWLTK